MARLPTGAALSAIFRTALTEAAEWAVARIVERTQSGEGLDGPFAEYSTGYEKLKRASGRPTSPPNLTASGDLLKLLKVLKVANAGAVIGWDRPTHRPFKFELGASRTRGYNSPTQGLVPRRGLIGPVPQGRAPLVPKSKLHLQRTGDDVPMDKMIEGLERLRPFFGLTDTEVTEMQQRFGDRIKALLSEYIRTH